MGVVEGLQVFVVELEDLIHRLHLSVETDVLLRQDLDLDVAVVGLLGHPPALQLAHRGVVGGPFEQGLQQSAEGLTVVLLGDPSGLLENFDGLLGLVDGVEGRRQGREGLQVLRVGLEGNLELAERGHPVVGLVALQVQLAGQAGVFGVGPELQEALQNLEGVVLAPEAQHDPRGLAESFDGLVDLTEPGARVGDPQVGDGVLGIELDDLLEDVERVPFSPLLAQPGSYLVVGRQGVAGQAELGVDLGQARHDVAVAPLEMLGVAPDDAADLLVDRDGLHREAFAVVELADLLVGLDGGFVGVELEVQVADLEKGPNVSRVVDD